MIENDEIYFGKDDRASPKLKRFLRDVKEGMTWTTLWDFAPFNTSGSNEMSEIFGNSVMFENPKPVGLLEHIIDMGAEGDDIVLDFFAGASSTAHAVMKKMPPTGGNANLSWFSFLNQLDTLLKQVRQALRQLPIYRKNASVGLAQKSSKGSVIPIGTGMLAFAY
ncbi:site-specific DNA-methyltransferase [Hoeflea sp. G2-23]|uniref:site-specific DNA-methyltransferase (adenine-specific) n=1 Tax=Hoeflea algicola TaxID=2983763 RepID=A0ABT3ZEH6_9HYPH|nr:DNA methyltransferase [Hoeflea algicola]MCY0150205.1 site-specific DNA-methyltransferase [Hoeflea algicola]